MEDHTITYFTEGERTVSISGHGVLHGGMYSVSGNPFTDEWILPLHSAPPLNYSFEHPGYRSQYQHLGFEIQPIDRWGWYDSYAFGGFVVKSDRAATASTFRAQIAQLREAHWIDRLTRAFTVSTMLLNPATGLGALVTVLFEMPRDGVIRITPDVLVMQRTKESKHGFDLLNQYAAAPLPCRPLVPLPLILCLLSSAISSWAPRHLLAYAISPADFLSC